MNKQKICIRISLIIFTFFFLFCSCSKKDADPLPRNLDTINTDFSDDIRIIDPGLTTDSITFRVLTNVMEGLTRVGPDGLLVPGMSRSWKVSKNGLNYTFYLRDAKWSDGVKVTAKDFEYAWKRVMNPKTAAQYAYIVTDYVKDVRATDELTLTVNLLFPIPYFLSLTSFPTYLPLRQDLVEKYGQSYGTSPKKAAYNGPFVVFKWQKGSRVSIKRNHNYWDEDNVKLEKVNFIIVKDPNTLVQMYDTNQLNLIYQAPGDHIKRYSNSPELSIRPEAVIDYLIFNLKNDNVPQLANKKIRNALSIALDRKAYVEKVEKQFLPAYGFVPPSINGKDMQHPFRQCYGDRFKVFYDPNTIQAFKMSVWFDDNRIEEAKKLLKEGLHEEKADSLSFTLLIDDLPSAKKLGQALQYMWRKNLGIKVRIEMVTYQTRLQRVRSKNYEVANVLWGADYNDPMTFLDMFVKNAGFNDPGWSNAHYDELLREARATNDQERRMKLFVESERILIDEMPIAPLFYRMPYMLKPKYIKEVVFVPCGADQCFKWAYIEK